MLNTSNNIGVAVFVF